MPTVNGVLFAFLVKISGYRYCPQPVKKERANVVAIPGVDSGIMILNNIPSLEHPSMEAASSSATGMPSKKLLSSKIGNAIDVAMIAIITPIYVSYSPILFKVLKIGMEMTTCGITWVMKMINE